MKNNAHADVRFGHDGVEYRVELTDVVRVFLKNGGEYNLEAPLHEIPLRHFAGIAKAVADLSSRVEEPSISMGWSSG